jgi:serine/threonine protein kinase
MVGQILGHYRIIQKIGEGGMGVVYKAEDTHLDRLVAIKVLPADKTTEPDRIRRFILEAKAASALNHPNIVHIYDIADADGLQYIAMELIEGKSLDRAIGRKGMPLGDALNCAVQITEALARAHASGILHRDLKPTNVMITDTGLIKLVDFGLAKLLSQSSTNEAATTETVTTNPLTDEGQVIGTTAYMSPEQAEGKPVDARSDIFSVGALLYEMVTGQRAFGGSSKASVLAAILEKEPRPVTEIVPSIPRELERVINRCLRKNPEYRFQTSADLKVALRELKEESDSGTLAAHALSVNRSKPRHLLPYVSLLILLIGAAALTTIWTRTRVSTRRPTPIRVTSSLGFTGYPTISADGKLIAYASDRDGAGNLNIWLKRLPNGEPTRLTHGDVDNYDPCFLPDGSGLLFYSEQNGGEVHEIPIPGGQEIRVAVNTDREDMPLLEEQGRLRSWHRCRLGRWFGNIPPRTASPRLSAQQFLWHKVSGGLTSPDEHLMLTAPRQFWSPRVGGFEIRSGPAGAIVPIDSKRPPPYGFIAFGRHETDLLRPVGDQGILIGSLNAWIQDQFGVDRLIFSGRRDEEFHLYQIAFSPKTKTIIGAPEVLVAGSGNEGQIAIADDGTAVFTSGVIDSNIWALQVGGDRIPMGSAHQLTTDLGSDYHPSLAANGELMVYVSQRSGISQLYLRNLQTNEEHVFAQGDLARWAPIMARDGSIVAYSVLLKQGPAVYTAPTNGTAGEEVCGDCGPACGWSSDATRLLFISNDSLWYWDRASRRKTEVLPGISREARSNQRIWWNRGCVSLSPDNRWIALSYRELFPSGSSRADGEKNINSFGVYVAPFHDSGVEMDNAVMIAADQPPDVDLDWSTSGETLYFTSRRDGFDVIAAQMVNPSTKKPVGDPSIIYRQRVSTRSFLNTDGDNSMDRHLLPPLRVSVSHNKVIFTAQRSRANIWLTNVFGL